MTAEERLADLDAQVKAQRKRFDEAVSQGMTGAPLARLDQKMARLERERDDLFDKIRAANTDEDRPGQRARWPS